MQEIWKESIVRGYAISNLGRLKNLKTNNIIKGDREEKGYCRLSIVVNGKKKHYAIHRLVAIAFIPNPNNLPQVDHIDFNKSNNCVSNLRWCSNKENSQWFWKKVRERKIIK